MEPVSRNKGSYTEPYPEADRDQKNDVYTGIGTDYRAHPEQSIITVPFYNCK
ncbi:MAG: hypothetical protein K0S33_968 [Bacteroidetes bacterium]|nr:hypothetical protein [Bacteroidota bacterium]